ncbi:MAG: SipW-dependent-type signal peptide-containing protein [Candidatus Velamenicoccus archaeovorus]
MARPRRVRWLVLPGVLGLVIGVLGSGTYAAFSSSTSTSASITAAADWVGPDGSSVIAGTSAPVAGTIAAAQTYYVFAMLSDFGNPPSGIATVTADVSGISAGQTAVPLVAGSFSVGGVTYNYRSASVTADAGLPDGTISYSLAVTDVNGNTGTLGGYSVVIDNTSPAPADIQANVGNGIPGAGDVLVFTFSEAMAPGSILGGWTGSSTPVQILMRNGGCGTNDSATVLDAGGGSGVHLGTVCLGDVINGNRTFGTSSMAMAGATVTVTLGGTPGGTKAAADTTLVWTPDGAATDVAGNPCSTTAVSESGPLDTDF